MDRAMTSHAQRLAVRYVKPKGMVGCKRAHVMRMQLASTSTAGLACVGVAFEYSLAPSPERSGECLTLGRGYAALPGEVVRAADGEVAALIRTEDASPSIAFNGLSAGATLKPNRPVGPARFTAKLGCQRSIGEGQEVSAAHSAFNRNGRVTHSSSYSTTTHQTATRPDGTPFAAPEAA